MSNSTIGAFAGPMTRAGIQEDVELGLIVRVLEYRVECAAQSRTTAVPGAGS